MANTFLTPDVVARAATTLLVGNLVHANNFSQNYEAELRGQKVGDRIRVRRRGAGVVREYNGSAITLDPITESPIYMILEKHFDASFEVTNKELTLSIQDFSSQVLAPRLVAMAESIDSYCAGKLLHAPNPGGPSSAAPAALPSSLADWGLLDKTLNDLRVPMTGRKAILSTEAKAITLGVNSLVEFDKSGSTEALRNARIGRIMGFDSYVGQNVPTATHTTGTMTTALVNAGSGVAAGSTSIPFDTASGASATILANDIILIAGYGYATVAANVTASSSAGTITIVEPLRETVANNAAITIYDGGGNTRQCHGAVFHPEAFQIAVVPLELPMSAKAAGYYRDENTGFAIRYVMDYDRDSKSDVISLDCLVGAAMIDGRKCAQIIKNI